MEERRLKNILSHLSAYPPSQMGKSAVVNFTSSVEKHVACSPGNMHLQPQKHIVHSPISRSRSSSDMMERRQLGFVEESPVRGDEWCAASLEGLPSHSHTSELMRAGSLWSKRHSSEEVENSMCMYMRDGSKTHTQGHRLRTTDSNQVHGINSICFHPDFSPLGAAKVEWSMQGKSLHLKDKLAVGFQEKQIDSRHSVAFDRSISKQQSQMYNASLSFEGDHHQEIAFDSQSSTRSSDTLQSTDEGDIQNCKNMHTIDSQTVEVGKDTAGIISRNNVMTGQRRRIVEDCVFCLIIQGQSPAFKVYEDEMCVCILDVHPLSHGHSLLIPKAHFPSLELTPPEVAAAMCATVPLISMAIMQATNCDSFNLLVNSGKAAGQVVFHTHFHIIPRRTGDNLWRSEDSSRRALPVGHETALLVQQIRHNLSNKHL